MPVEHLPRTDNAGAPQRQLLTLVVDANVSDRTLRCGRWPHEGPRSAISVPWAAGGSIGASDQSSGSRWWRSQPSNEPLRTG